MTWENYGEWEIDHKMPLFKFDLSSEKDLKKVCHYTNLQPLPYLDNLIKGSKFKSVTDS